MSELVQRAHVIFHGRVQGVGFRYTVSRAATAYENVTGIVSNLPNGTVELIAEGSTTDITALLSDIRGEMARYITDMQTEVAETYRAYKSFSIGY